MVVKVVWTQRALSHFKTELEYYGKIHVKLARELSQLVDEAIKKIASAPGIGRPGKSLGSREFILTQYPYIIAYRERNDILEVLAFIHQKRKNIQSYY